MISSIEDQLRRDEGLRLTPYRDSNFGDWTIGWGHDIPAPEGDEDGLDCTPGMAALWFAQDFGEAAAQAEAGCFSEAAETARRALALAQSSGNVNLAAALQARLQLYQSG